MSRRSQLVAALLVVVLVSSPVVGSVSLVGSASAAPDGFVGVPDTNIEEDLPVGANTSISAADLEGSVMASQNASSLQVILTTPARAEEYVGSAVGGGGGGIALIFQDDKAHAGRRVAVPADAIRESVGHIPKVVHGVHEDGSSWTSDVTARNGLLIFKIPKFSANSVTFDADVSIDATATDGTTLSYDLGSMDSATDPVVNLTGVENTETDIVSSTLSNGQSFDLGVSGTSSGTDASVTMTGQGFGTRTDSASGSSVSLTHTKQIGVEGALEPTDGLGGDPKITVSANGGSPSTYNPIDAEGDGGRDYNHILAGDTNTDGTQSGAVRLDPDSSGTLTGLTVNIVDVTGGELPAPIDIYVESGTPDTTVNEGKLVKSGWTPSWSTGEQSVNFASGYDVSAGTSVTVNFVMTGSNNDGSADKLRVANTDSTSGTWYSSSFGISSGRAADVTATIEQGVSGVSVSDGAGASASVGDLSPLESKTVALDLSTDSTKLAFDGSGAGSLDYSMEWTERDKTVDPSLDVDGDGTAEASYSGVLAPGDSVTRQLPDLSIGATAEASTASASAPASFAATYTEHTETSDVSVGLNTDGGGGEWVNLSRPLNGGETVSRTFSKATLQEGTNRLTVSLGDGSLSADAPVPKVNLSYMHASSVSIDTSYVADGWAESYNVSHTFAGNRDNPTATVPFSSHVYRIPQVEMSVNGGVWENVSASKWSLENGTELTVELTDHDDSPGVEAGDTIAVRTTGYKVDATNGQIRIVDPTAPDDPSVDAGFVVESRQSGFRINVGGTENAQKVHYLYEEGWTNPAEEAVISADGGQSLWVPHATEGAAARVTTIPLEPAPDTGDVGVQVIDPDAPTFKVTPGKAGVGDSVTWRWYSATSGERYGLRSLSRGRFVDKSDAGPQYVSLTGDDSGETMAIQQPDGSSSGTGISDVTGVGGGVWSDPTQGVSIQEIGIVAGWAAFVVLLVAATGRSSIRGRKRWIAVSAVSAGTGLLSLEIIRPGVVSSAVSSGLQDVVPLAGLATIALVGFSVYSWWKKRRAEASTPETKVSFNLGNQK